MTSVAEPLELAGTAAAEFHAVDDRDHSAHPVDGSDRTPAVDFPGWSCRHCGSDMQDLNGDVHEILVHAQGFAEKITVDGCRRYEADRMRTACYTRIADEGIGKDGQALG